MCAPVYLYPFLFLYTMDFFTLLFSTSEYTLHIIYFSYLHYICLIWICVSIQSPFFTAILHNLFYYKSC